MKNNLQRNLYASLIERDEEVDAILLGLVAQRNVMFGGVPGLAKSHLCRSVATAIEGMTFCERLIGPTTPPEVLFGPVSITKMREDKYEHVGEGTITDCHLLFLDEVFRGSDAILDTLLHLLGPEKQALIGTQQVQVPLMCAIGATNTWPDSAHQAAIFDRWLIRRTVHPVSPNSRERLLFNDLPPVTPQCTLENIKAAQAAAKIMPVSQAAKEALMEIINELNSEGIRPSDRRMRESVVVAKADAVICGDSEVLPMHLECLQDVLWDDPNDQPQKTAEIVVRIANPVGARLNAIIREATEIVDNATAPDSQSAGLKKLRELEREASQMASIGNGRSKKCHAYVQESMQTVQARLLGIDSSKAASV